MSRGQILTFRPRTLRTTKMDFHDLSKVEMFWITYISTFRTWIKNLLEFKFSFSSKNITTMFQASILKTVGGDRLLKLICGETAIKVWVYNVNVCILEIPNPITLARKNIKSFWSFPVPPPPRPLLKSGNKIKV